MSDSAYSEEYVTDITKMVGALPQYVGSPDYYQLEIKARSSKDWSIGFINSSSPEKITSFLTDVEALNVDGVSVDLKNNQLKTVSFECFHQVFASYIKKHLKEDVSKVLSEQYLSVLEKHGKLPESQRLQNPYGKAPYPRSAFAIMNGFQSVCQNLLNTRFSNYNEKVELAVGFRSKGNEMKYIFSCTGKDSQSDINAIEILEHIHNNLSNHVEDLETEVQLEEHEGDKLVVVSDSDVQNYVTLLSRCYTAYKIFGPEEVVIPQDWAALPIDQKNAFNCLREEYKQTAQLLDMDFLPMIPTMSRDDMLKRYFFGYNAPVFTSMMEIEAIAAHEQGFVPDTKEQRALFVQFALQ